MNSFFFVLLLVSQEDASPRKGVVEGVVINGVSKAPVRKATVILQGLQKQGMHMDTVQSGAGGRFRFESVPEGTYKILANRTGFAFDATGGISIELNPEGKTGLVVALAPQAALNGRVLDEDEDPVLGAMIQVEAVRPSARGGPMAGWAGNGGGASTNDRGEFRVFGLAPGKYRVRASMNPGMRASIGRPRRNGQTPKPTEEDYVATYFPSSVSSDEATIVTLAPDDDRQGIEIRLRKNRLFTVSGHVTVPTGWKPETPPEVPANIAQNMPLGMVMLMPAKPGIMGMNVGGSGQIQKDGSFEIRGVAPGEYRARAQLMSMARGGDANSLAASARATVTSADVGGIEISIHAPVPVNGTMTFRGEKPKSQDLAVHLIPLDVADGITGPLVAKVDLNTGKFQFDKVPAGDYRVNVSASDAPDHYLEDVKEIGSDGLLHVQAPVNLLLATASPGGAVRGVVADEKSGAKVVIWPDSGGPYLVHLVQVAEAGEGGKYEFRGVKPGKYRIAAFASLPLTGFGVMQYPEESILKDAKSEKIEVQGGGTETAAPRLNVNGEKEE